MSQWGSLSNTVWSGFYITKVSTCLFFTLPYIFKWACSGHVSIAWHLGFIRMRNIVKTYVNWCSKDKIKMISCMKILRKINKEWLLQHQTTEGMKWKRWTSSVSAESKHVCLYFFVLNKLVWKWCILRWNVSTTPNN